MKIDNELIKELKNYRRFLVAACDAGGAEVLSYWINNSLDISECYFVLEGPAKYIFPKNIDTEIKLIEKEQALNLLEKGDCALLVATSWASDLETSFIRFSRGRVKSFAFLDHWTNYKERFSNPREKTNECSLALPDQIIVFDVHAYKLALEIFSKYKVEISRQDNFYIKEKVKLIRELTSTCSKMRVLYICQPVEDDLKERGLPPTEWGHTEFDLLDIAFSAFESTDVPIEVRLRLHPKERMGKYDKYSSYNVELNISNNPDIEVDIAWSDLVIGGQTMGLVLALEAGKNVLTIENPNSPGHCRLPHEEILRVEGFESITKELENCYEKIKDYSNN